MNPLTEKLKNTDSSYYPVPFWSWNDNLDSDMLTWQIEQMKAQKLGGYFMHARSGIQTPYLSEDWFECIKTGLDGAKANEMNAWIYDESGWPSGFAGGLVTDKGINYHAKGLKLVYPEQETTLPDEQLLGVYNSSPPFKKISNANKTSKHYKVYYTVCPSYVDVLDPKVIKYYIETTHEEYYKRYGDKYKDQIKGFFTDEPRLSEGDIPWSYLLKTQFKHSYGYNIIQHLPLLFLEGDGHEKVRYDFWQLVSKMFTKSFMKQIYDWCNNHDCKLTGHVMMEETIYSQMTGTAGSMPFYEYMHIPGVDWLRRTMESAIVSKQVGSVAEQLGKKQVLTETYALAGWDVSFEELKWMAEWQYVNGVNLMCQHLEAYSLRGMRKRDYPPSLFIQQSWWSEYSVFNDYLGRLGHLLSEGIKQVEILLLHPMQSGWVLYNGKNSSALKDLDQSLLRATEDLLSQHLDFHYGDEQIIDKHACVENDVFHVGNAAYKAVVLPSMLTIASTTLNLLQQFVSSGGKVFCYGNYPVLCDGQPSRLLETFHNEIIFISSKQELRKQLQPLLETKVSVSANGEEIENIRYNLTTHQNEKVLFLANLSKTASYSARVEINISAGAELIDLVTMETRVISCETTENSIVFSLSFAPMQSHIVQISSALFHEKETSVYSNEILLSNQNQNWEIVKSDLNSLTLDCCKYRIDGGEQQPEMPVIALMQKLLNLKKACNLEQQFTFTLDVDPKTLTECFIAIERPEKYELFLNGIKLETPEIGWWKDSAFRKVNVLSHLKSGVNTLSVTGEFHQPENVYHVLFDENVYETELNQLSYDTELESIYLVGDFGVFSQTEFIPRPRNAITSKGGFVITEKPTKLFGKNFSQQGLLFFAGKLTIQRQLNLNLMPNTQYNLNLGRPRASMLKLYVNKNLVKTILWAPYTVDITSFLQQGNNLIEVELFASNRNLLGPHHHIDGEIYNVGPESFTGQWSWVERPTEGVMANPADFNKNYWDDRYTFVTFGL